VKIARVARASRPWLTGPSRPSNDVRSSSTWQMWHGRLARGLLGRLGPAMMFVQVRRRVLAVPSGNEKADPPCSPASCDDDVKSSHPGLKSARARPWAGNSEMRRIRRTVSLFALAPRLATLQRIDPGNGRRTSMTSDDGEIGLFVNRPPHSPEFPTTQSPDHPISDLTRLSYFARFRWL
jgi:hypothetical protein